jgi:hypothetical protein
VVVIGEDGAVNGFNHGECSPMFAVAKPSSPDCHGPSSHKIETCAPSLAARQKIAA